MQMNPIEWFLIFGYDNTIDYWAVVVATIIWVGKRKLDPIMPLVTSCSVATSAASYDQPGQVGNVTTKAA